MVATGCNVEEKQKQEQNCSRRQPKWGQCHLIIVIATSLIITKKHQSLSSQTWMVLPPTNCELWSDIPGSLTVLEADKEAPLFGDPGVWPFRHKTYQLYILCYIASCYQHDNPETFLALYTRAMQPPSPAWRSNCNASLYSILTAARNKARKLNGFAPLTSLVSQMLE